MRPPLAPRLKYVEAAIERYDLANAELADDPQTSVFPWNWKVMFENNNDGYHANRLHSGPLHDFIPSSMASFPELPEDRRVICATTAPGIRTLASTPRRKPYCRYFRS